MKFLRTFEELNIVNLLKHIRSGDVESAHREITSTIKEQLQMELGKSLKEDIMLSINNNYDTDIKSDDQIEKFDVFPFLYDIAETIQFELSKIESQYSHNIKIDINQYLSSKLPIIKKLIIAYREKCYYENDIQEMADEISNIDDQLSDMEYDMDNEIDNLRCQIYELEDGLEEILSEIKMYEGYIFEWEIELKEEREVLIDLQKDKEAAKSDKDNYDLAMIEDDIAEVESRINQLEIDIKSYKDILKTSNEEKIRYETRIDELNNSINDDIEQINVRYKQNRKHLEDRIASL